MKPKIVGWLTVDEAIDLADRGKVRNPESLGHNSGVPTIFNGIGTHDWNDYIIAQPAADRPYIEALREVIVAKKFRAAFYWMDRGSAWVPRFEDDTILDFTSGGWCELQAAIWSEEEGVQYGFQDWQFAHGNDEPFRDRAGHLTYQVKEYANEGGETQ